MIIDDLATWLVATDNYMNPLTVMSPSRTMLNVDNLWPFISAASTTGVPLVRIYPAQVITRNFSEPQQAITLFLDAVSEDVEPYTNHQSLITLKVDAYIFVMRSAIESVARDQTKAYMGALLACMETYPDYFGFENRNYYDGVEGKPDIKAAKATLIIKFEE